MNQAAINKIIDVTIASVEKKDSEILKFCRDFDVTVKEYNEHHVLVRIKKGLKLWKG